MSEPVIHNKGDKHAPGTRVVWANGVVAVVQADGRHVIESTPAAAAAAARATPRYSKALGAKAAARAFNKYYSQKQYKSPRAKKAAMTRDLCHGKKAKYVRRTTAYKASRNGRLTGPGHYDYPGVDDGSRCPQNGGFMEEDEMEQFGAGCRLKSTGRCVSAPSDRMHPSCEVGPRYMRKGKQMPGRCRKVKSPKKKSPRGRPSKVSKMTGHRNPFMGSK